MVDILDGQSFAALVLGEEQDGMEIPAEDSVQSDGCTGGQNLDDLL